MRAVAHFECETSTRERYRGEGTEEGETEVDLMKGIK